MESNQNILKAPSVAQRAIALLRETGEVPEDPETVDQELKITLADLYERLREPELSKKLLRDVASTITNSLEEYGFKREFLDWYSLSGESFETFYDPSAPTILVDPYINFSGNEMLGIVAYEPETRANIVYISTSAGHAKIVNTADDGNHLVVTHGVCVLPGGKVIAGKFPEPIRADAIDTADITLIEQCEAAGIHTLHSSENERELRDKRKLRSLVSPEIINIPKQITEDAFLSREDISGLVIKPAGLSQGTGVYLTDEHTDPQRAKETYNFLKRHGYDPLVEERIRSWPITDPETGERLDWNVRAIASNGQALGMYVRAETWGKTVNRSKGARAIPMEKLVDYTENEEVAQRLIRTLGAAATKLSIEYPSAIDGLDITIDESGEAALFELNGGRCGGIQTIAKLEDNVEEKPALVRKLLASWLPTLPAPTKFNYDPDQITEIPLKPSLDALTYDFCAVDEQSLLAFVELPTEMEEDYRQSYGNVFTKVVRQKIAHLCGDAEVATSAEKNLFFNHPIEVRSYLRRLASRAFDVEGLEGYLSETDSLLPQGEEIHRAKLELALQKFDMPTIAKLYKESEENDISPSKFIDEAAGELAGRFRIKQNNGEKADALLPSEFVVLMHDACFAYCNDGFESSDKLFAEQKLEDPLAQLVARCARYSFAVGSKEYEKSVAIFDEYCEDAKFVKFCMKFYHQI